MIAGLHYRRVEQSQRAAAFATYDESLRTTLALCVDGLAVVACEALAPPRPEPAPAVVKPLPSPDPAPTPILGGDEDTIPFPTSPPPSPSAPRPAPDEPPGE